MYSLRRAATLCRAGLTTRNFARNRSLKGTSSGLRSFSSCQRYWMYRNWSTKQTAVTLRKNWLPWRPLSSGNTLPPHTLVTLPALSPTMETGTLVKWEKEIGEEIEEGDIIAQVETDKATMDMETPEAGYLATIIVPEGTSDLPLGKVLAVIVESKEMIGSFKDFNISEDSTTTVTTPPQDTPPQTQPSSPPSVGKFLQDLPPHTVVTLPALSPTMDSGSLVKWEKEIGEEIEEGDIIAQVETDKATMDMETPSEGYLATILVPEGSRDIQLGKPLAIIAASKDDLEVFKGYVPSSEAPPPPTTTSPSPPTPSSLPSSQKATPTLTTPTPQPVSSTVGRIIASPYAKTLAREKGVDLASLQGSGPSGRIIGRDILQAATSVTAPVQAITTPAPAPGAEFEDIPLSGMRKTIAARLQLSKQTIPHYYLSVDVNMEDVLRLRSQINSDDLKLSVNDFIIKASALSMKHVPEINSSWMDTFIRRYRNVDISVAVSTSGGLITPIVFNADTKGLQSINEDVRQLAEKARAGKLQPHEFQGGTFTISNLGMYGIRNFSAVINPPQVCILAVGATQKRVIVDETSDRGFSSTPMMSVTLSCDHRVVDGAVGAEWLAVFKSYLEKPFKMLI